MTPEEIESLRMTVTKLYITGFTILLKITEQSVIDQFKTFLPICEEASNSLTFSANAVKESDLLRFNQAVITAMKFLGDEYNEDWPEG